MEIEWLVLRIRAVTYGGYQKQLYEKYFAISHILQVFTPIHKKQILDFSQQLQTLRGNFVMESAKTWYHVYDSFHLVSPRIWADHFLFRLHCLTNLAFTT